ncbi:hypothetical protein PROFUN_12687 [Planoprotostelium fungivorum]|uniref:Uncharacterized protein n=1 Tax=Planoprotostelium fungivorum TaxID=1890364 RepID=A0A2P6N6W9_9EUKA|nr:hypothetical protein PROFUN_12687 [Planoprotostelium fungivorum]
MLRLKVARSSQTLSRKNNSLNSVVKYIFAGKHTQKNVNKDMEDRLSACLEILYLHNPVLSILLDQVSRKCRETSRSLYSSVVFHHYPILSSLSAKSIDWRSFLFRKYKTTIHSGRQLIPADLFTSSQCKTWNDALPSLTQMKKRAAMMELSCHLNQLHAEMSITSDCKRYTNGQSVTFSNEAKHLIRFLAAGATIDAMKFTECSSDLEGSPSLSDRECSEIILSVLAPSGVVLDINSTKREGYTFQERQHAIEQNWKYIIAQETGLLWSDHMSYDRHYSINAATWNRFLADDTGIHFVQNLSDSQRLMTRDSALTDICLDHTNRKTQKIQEQCNRIAIIGSLGSGKTRLRYRFEKNVFNDGPCNRRQTYECVSLTRKMDGQDLSIQLMDFGGTAWLDKYDSCHIHGLIYMYDVSRDFSAQEPHRTDSGKLVILVGNQIGYKNIQVTEEEGRLLLDTLSTIDSIYYEPIQRLRRCSTRCAGQLYGGERNNSSSNCKR